MTKRSSEQRADWQLPVGVTRGVWDYANAGFIASDYDDYFADSGLMRLDARILQHCFHPKHGKWVVDLGSGTGRALIPLLRQGMRGLAIDLSQSMLKVAAAKAAAEGLPLTCLRANLVDLDCLYDESADYVMCLFSTLGMIQGTSNRAKVVRHALRILKPNGLFVLHAHNFWHNLLDPGGPHWLINNLLRSTWRRDVVRGDKFYDYRGIRNFYLHVFTKRETRRLLTSAGFSIDQRIAVGSAKHQRLLAPWLLGNVRARGWIIVSRKPARPDRVETRP